MISSPLILVSHRGPVQFSRDESGARQAQRGMGGLVTALSGLSGHVSDALWICAALTDEDVAVCREQKGQPFTPDTRNPALRVRFVELDEDVHQRFYTVIANPLLWFIQHYLWDLSNAPDITQNELEAFTQGYAVVNEQFAQVVAEEAVRGGPETVVLAHDYHFYLLAPTVRSLYPSVLLHHFVHIPWPQPDAWRVLPARLRDPLLRGLLGNDLVAFHTERYARNFLLTCQELLDLRVDFATSAVQVGERSIAVRWYPISIDATETISLARSPEVEEYYGRLEATRRDHLVLRVDRTDLSKNILRGFKAFDLLLDEHPELHGKVVFLALLQPSRQDVEEYVEYMERIRRLVADINLKHGTTDWQPIDLRFEDCLAQAMAAYRMFDVLMVNPVFDGMNLVAKEAILVNERNGVLVLSEHAGAYDELGAFALSVHPFDLVQQAEALYQALTMSLSERRDRREACVSVVRTNNLDKWLRIQLADIAQLRSEVRWRARVPRRRVWPRPALARR